MTHRRMILATAAVAALLAFAAAPANAAGGTISAGIDLWQTLGDGTTYTDFAAEPIPADFFCSGVEAFTGRVVFKGVPVATGKKGALGLTDTIVQRLDDAVFDERGVATTRIQVRALQFAGVHPVATSCGVFRVSATLAGDQPITTMRIIREHADGGHFLAPISVNVKLSFTPVGRRRASEEPREIVRRLDFAPSPDAVWSGRFGKAAGQHTGFVLVDTDADGGADTWLPGTSGFAAGWDSSPGTLKAAITEVPVRIAHCGNPPACTHNHTTTPPSPSDPIMQDTSAQ